MQTVSLRVQQDLRARPELVPVGMGLVIFVQYLGATVVQAVGGVVFAGVMAGYQVGDVEGYNRAVTRVFVSFVPLLFCWWCLVGT